MTEKEGLFVTQIRILIGKEKIGNLSFWGDEGYRMVVTAIMQESKLGLAR